MDPRLQALLDERDIRRTLAEYCNACDRCDEPRMAAVYLEDSWDDHGQVQASGGEFANIMTRRIRAETDSLFHMLGQSIITVEGDQAGAETYFLAVAESTDADGRKLCNQLGGRFIDRLERANGQWRIRRRTAVRDWGVSIPVQQDWTQAACLTEGRRTQADPCFAVLGFAHSDFDGSGC